MKNNRESLDNHWFNIYKELSVYSTVKYFRRRKEEEETQKKLFMGNEIENPVFNYYLIDNGELDERRKKLLEFRKVINKEENNPFVKKVYIGNIEPGYYKAEAYRDSR